MLKLRLLGTASLHADGDAVQGRATQRRRLALLALLAGTPDHSLTRDKLIGWLWPEHDQERARHLLAVSLYEMRKALGEDAILSRGEEVVLSRARLWIDVAEFEEALRRGELERAIELYTGPFLDGFYISDAVEFDQWVDARRDGYRRQYEAALEELAGARTQEGDFDGAVDAWHRLAAADPFSSRYAVGYMQALERAGDRARALRHARIHEALLKAEFDAGPDKAVVELAERIRSAPQPAPRTAEPAPTDAGAADVRAADKPAVDARATNAAPADATAADATAAMAAAGAAPPTAARDGTAQRNGAATAAVPAGAADNGESAPRAANVATAAASIAVLPFAPMSAEAHDDEYLGDGLADEIINTLGRVGGIRVISRTSTFRLKHQIVDVQEVGQQLGVATVLEGSVRLNREDLRIGVNLVNASDRRVLWSDTYMTALPGLFTVQESIARHIVEQLSGRLTGAAAAALAVRSTEDLDAYQHYLRGRYHWSARTPDNLLRARTHFKQALEADPGYVLALAGLSDVYNTLGSVEYGVLVPAEAYARAEAAAEEALRLDPLSANAHAALANIRLNRYRDWTGAEQAYRRTLELNPGYSQARHWFSLALMTSGRPDEAFEQIRRARELDPQSVTLSTSLGRHHYLARDFAEAVREYRRALDLDRGSLIALVALGMALVQQGDLDRAATAFGRADEAAGGRYLLSTAFLGHALAKSGQRRDALEILDRLEVAGAERFVPPEYAMIVHIGLGEHERAIGGLERALELGSGSLIFLDVEPLLDPLRSEPRFLELRRAVRRLQQVAGPDS